MMKIQIALILIAIFNTGNPFPVKINPVCQEFAMKGFPFYGQESVTLTQMIKNHEKTGLGADHLAHFEIEFQQADKNKDGLLEVGEMFIHKKILNPNFYCVEIE